MAHLYLTKKYLRRTPLTTIGFNVRRSTIPNCVKNLRFVLIPGSSRLSSAAKSPLEGPGTQTQKLKHEKTQRKQPKNFEAGEG